jgi:cation-transporting P-type ATPase D
VLVKSAVAMEHLAEVEIAAFDKTGTLTSGRPRLACVQVTAGHTETQVLRLAAAAEQDSEHPLGRAVTAAARARGIAVPVAANFLALPGRGVQATVEGRRVQVLSPAAVPGELSAVRRLEESGATAVVVLVDDAVAGVLGLCDTLRAGAAAAVGALAALGGRQPVLITGDNHCAAAHLAEQVGIAEVHAGLLPEHKVEIVRGLPGRVLVVGDGVNDAPAMAAAHTSIAMGGRGADLTLQTADAIIIADELNAIPAVVALARRARRTMLANLAIAATFIAVLVVWDLFWYLPLPLGVAGHEGSTVLVALNGLRLLRNRAWHAG